MVEALSVCLLVPSIKRIKGSILFRVSSCCSQNRGVKSLCPETLSSDGRKTKSLCWGKIVLNSFPLCDVNVYWAPLSSILFSLKSV